MSPEAEADHLLEGLNDEQRSAVTSDASPLAILAGAGSGKTRVLTRRIAYRALTGVEDPRRVLALTFTRAAAAELGERLGRLGLRDRPTAGTFHAVAFAQLRRHWADHGRTAPALLDRKGRVLGRLKGVKGPDVAEVAAEIDWAKARLVNPSRYAEVANAADRRPPGGTERLADIYSRYETEKRRRGLIDFDDLLWNLTRLLETDEAAAGAQRWAFRHLYVDEFQDVNPLQFRLLQAWLGDRRDLTVVGDPNQAIYAWNGADPELLAHFVDRFAGAGEVRLECNYRSGPEVLALANRILDAGALTGVRLRPTRPEGAEPAVLRFGSDTEESAALAAALRAHHGPGHPWSHHAVLVRTNALVNQFADSLRAAGIPVQVLGQQPFAELPEIRDAMVALARAPRFSDAVDALEAAVLADEDRETGVRDGGGEAGGTAPRSPAEETRHGNRLELVRLAAEYFDQETAPDAAGFAAWLTASTGEHATVSADAVTVATFHAAKGLEWPWVHLAGLEAGLVPIGHAVTPEALAEERRLFYVAVTRAMEHLTLSHADRRTFGTRAQRRTVSPFLPELEPVLAVLARRSRPGDAGTRLAETRATVAAQRPVSPVSAEDSLVRALLEWRRRRSLLARLPAVALLDDRALRAIAEGRPADVDGLRLVPGVGPTKAVRFGAEILEIVARYSRQDP